MKCLLVFQPHLFTRTRDFAEKFAAVLDSADETLLLPIYPARELPLEGISSEWLLGMMKNPARKCMEKEQLLQWLGTQNLKDTVVVMAGAGDIDRLVQPVAELMERSLNEVA
jgi:UDP-N-acetylmuramate--alanine ligase